MFSGTKECDNKSRACSVFVTGVTLVCGLFVMRLVIVYSSFVTRFATACILFVVRLEVLFVQSCTVTILFAYIHQMHFIYDVGQNYIYISLEAFAVTEFSKIFSGRQLCQGV